MYLIRHALALLHIIEIEGTVVDQITALCKPFGVKLPFQHGKILTFMVKIRRIHTRNADRHNGTDFRIVQKTAKFGSEEPYQPISDELVQKIRDQEFVEDFRVTYMARTKPDWSILRGGYYPAGL